MTHKAQPEMEMNGDRDGNSDGVNERERKRYAEIGLNRRGRDDRANK